MATQPIEYGKPMRLRATDLISLLRKADLPTETEIYAAIEGVYSDSKVKQDSRRALAYVIHNSMKELHDLVREL